MQPEAYIGFCRRILEKCGCDSSAAIFSLLPSTDHNLPNSDVFHTLENIAAMIDSAERIFCQNNKKTGSKSSAYNLITANLPLITKKYADYRRKKGLGEAIIPNNRQLIALAILTHIYLDTFEAPKQFFLPYSSSCSGQWIFWENIDYFKMKLRYNELIYNNVLSEAIEKKEVWDIKIRAGQFNEIIKRRLEKENAFSKQLSPLAMIKAIIIRLGEIASPNLNYESIDFSIRSLFRYLEINDFVRVDREIYFCRQLELNLAKSFKSLP